MEEKENPPVKPRKLKKIDEYKEKIPLAWRFYQRELEKGAEPRKAELKAVKKVYPGDKNSSTTLSVWKKYGLWPLAKYLEENLLSQSKKGLTVIDGHKNKFGLSDLLNRNLSPSSLDSLELSEKEILQKVRKILDKIEVHHREWSGGRTRKYSTLKTRILAGRLPVELLNEINRFKGSKTFHLERALRLYVKVMGTKATGL